MSNLIGKRILIVDEVDDTRTTLEYAVKELEKDVEAARQKLGIEGETMFSIFVLHISVLSDVYTGWCNGRGLTRSRIRTRRRRGSCQRTC
jgi:hypoxanthine phosphoribosyltransferase